MKHVIFLLVGFQICFCNICYASESEKILADVWRRMDAVPLPDGYSIFGKRITETILFDTKHLGTRGSEAHKLATDLIHIINNPLKNSSIIWGNTYYSVEEIMHIYMSVIKTFYNLTSDTVLFFEGLFLYGEVCRIKIPGLDITTPTSRARAELFIVLSKWRVHGGASEADALEAIRIERERLDAIAAEEEANRKAEVEAKAAEQFRKPEPTSGLRKRHAHVKTPSDDEHPTPTIKDPLLRPVKAH